MIAKISKTEAGTNYHTRKESLYIHLATMALVHDLIANLQRCTNLSFLRVGSPCNLHPLTTECQ
jgi:hypothetical protein